MGIRTEDAETLIQTHGGEAISAGLDALSKRMASEFPEPLRDPYRYLRALLEGNAATAAKKAEQGSVDSAASSAAAAAAVEGWTAEWVSRRRAQVMQEFEVLDPESQADWIDRLRKSLQERGVHPSIRKRLETHGWNHPMVAGELIRFFKGPDWDKPTPQELLAIAAKQGVR